MQWYGLDRDQWRALVTTVMKFPIPSNAGKVLSSSTTGDFSRRAQLNELCCLFFIKVCDTGRFIIGILCWALLIESMGLSLVQ
jgi:hypothetical protein